MKITRPVYFEKFACIADRCPDTCCAGWDIVIDGESLEKYGSLSSPYGDKIRSLITADGDGESIFAAQGGRCPFLLDSGLCEMYKEIGHENLCLTCRKFPRFTNTFGARLEEGLSLSCPEAARLIFESDEPAALVSKETDGAIIPSDFDAELYFTLLAARKKAIDILQQRKFSVEHRICAFLEFSQALQQLIKEDCLEKAASLSAEFFLSLEHTYSQAKAKRALNRFSADFSSLEFIRPDFGDKLRNIECVDMQGFAAPDWEYEHLMIYFIFRYFITAAYDGDVLTKAKFAAVSVIAVKRLHAALGALTKEQRTDISQKYSKEIEHCSDNLDYLFRSMKKSRYYGTENLINILSEGEKA
ncbi:MAG: flagellin lysine-N-methylase [Clostridia bacterium]|nr:flagellin lysine-N-methylase [Clostridia bacterium]